MSKEFIDTHVLQKNVFTLAEKIYNDAFIPTVIYVSMRGGAILGNIISEYFKLSAPPSFPPLYATVVVQSYAGVQDSINIMIDGWTYPPDRLRRHDRVLLVDDIFDSGNTINILCKTIVSNGIALENLRIAVHDYKIRKFEEVNHQFIPDYYCRKIEVESPENDQWIHYLSHEIDGLTNEEIEQNYPPNLHQAIKKLIQRRQQNLKENK